MKTKTMNNPLDDLTAFISGIFGGGIYLYIAGISWQTAWENLGNLLWLGFVAMLTGGAGVLGKHLVNKYLNRKKGK